MTKLDKFLNNLEDPMLIDLITSNIKVKYSIPTYYCGDVSFDDVDCNYNTFNTDDTFLLNQMISNIIKDNIQAINPNKVINKSRFNVKQGEEYWIVYKDRAPTHIVIYTTPIYYVFNTGDIIKYQSIYFNIKSSGILYLHLCDHIDKSKDLIDLNLFNTKEEAIIFFNNKFDLNL